MGIRLISGFRSFSLRGSGMIVPAPGLSADSVAPAVARTNRKLPDYARVNRWLIADEPFSVANGMLSGNGRVRRDQVNARYAGPIDSLYQEEAAS